MDWTIILAIGILAAVVLWGPKKIPDLARSLGSAKREFEAASRGDLLIRKPGDIALPEDSEEEERKHAQV